MSRDTSLAVLRDAARRAVDATLPIDDAGRAQASELLVGHLCDMLGGERAYIPRPPKDQRNRQMMADAERLGATEAARRAGVSRQTVYRVGFGSEDWQL